MAVKIIDCKTAAQDFVQNFMPRELEISKQVKHNNLLTTLDHFELNNKNYIITELARFDLLQYLRLKGGLRETLVRRIFYELISGIDHLHQNGLVHRDIKCENLLISTDGTVKVADFGFARTVGDSELTRGIDIDRLIGFYVEHMSIPTDRARHTVDQLLTQRPKC